MQLQKRKGKSVVIIMFTSFIKHHIRRFHIVVVQLTSFCNHLYRYDKKRKTKQKNLLFFSNLCFVLLNFFFKLNQISIK